MQLSDYNTQIRELVHDLASVDWADSELTNSINSARSRVALDAHCVRNLFTGINLIASQETYPITGGVAGYVITNPGANYSNPVVTVAAPTGVGVLTTARATATQTAGAITSIFATNWGTGYSTNPVVTIADSLGGIGSGATATPITIINIFDIVSITPIWPGGLQSQSCNWSPFSEFQAWARSYRGSFGYPVEFTTHLGINKIYVARIPDQPYITEIDAVGAPTPLVNPTDVDAQILYPFSDCVQWWGAYMSYLKLQNFAAADYFQKVYEKRIQMTLYTIQSRRIRNIYASTYRRRQRGG